MGTLKPQSNGNTVIGTLVVDGGLLQLVQQERVGGLWSRPVPSSLYQNNIPSQRPLYRLILFDVTL